MNRNNPPAVEALTFDCYGTLVDWETGILGTLRPLLARHDRQMPDGELLSAYAETESTIQAQAYRPYRAVLREVTKGLAQRFGFQPSSEDLEALASGLPDWPVFPDTADALRALAEKYRLAIVSNIDDGLFAGTQSRIGVEFSEVVTAEQVQSYKPGYAHFDTVLDRLQLPRESVLHVAQSLYHDIAPARALGFDTVWVNRRDGQDGAGATPGSDATPTYTVPSLKAAAELLCGAEARTDA